MANCFYYINRNIFISTHRYINAQNEWSVTYISNYEIMTWWEYSKNQGVKLTVIRPTNVYGPGSKPWVIDVATQLQSGLPSLVAGGGQNAGLCHVDNLVELFVLAAKNPKAVNRIYNGSDGSNVTWKRYFTDIAKAIHASEPRSVPFPIAKFGTMLCETAFKTFKINKLVS